MLLMPWLTSGAILGPEQSEFQLRGTNKKSLRELLQERQSTSTDSDNEQSERGQCIPDGTICEAWGGVSWRLPITIYRMTPARVRQREAAVPWRTAPLPSSTSLSQAPRYASFILAEMH